MKTVLTHVCLLVGMMTAVEAVIAADRPNIVFILADDLTWTDAGCYGHPDVKTPNIDRLAASGMLFTNAHCAAPACNPSRTAIMTGISPNVSGLYDNRQKMRELLPEAETHLFPAGHFALETHAPEIAAAVRGFMTD